MSELPGRSPKKWSRVVQQIHVKFLKSKVIFHLSIFCGVGWSLSDLRLLLLITVDFSTLPFVDRSPQDRLYYYYSDGTPSL